MRMAFFFDQSRCMACNACTVACKDYYDVNPGTVRYRKQKTHEVGADKGYFASIVMSCNHCKEPACMASCPFSAITKRADGIVVVDRNKCRNSQACISACPFSEPGIANDKQEPTGKDTWQVNHPMQKCNFCVDRLSEGKKPICVAACPVRAIEAGDYDELKRLHADAVPLDDEKLRYAYTGTNYATGPSLLIKMKRPLEID